MSQREQHMEELIDRWILYLGLMPAGSDLRKCPERDWLEVQIKLNRSYEDVRYMLTGGPPPS